MKNIHVISTDKSIKNVGDLVKDQYGDIHIFTKNDGKEYGKTTTKLNIYITNSEEIKEGDWCLDIKRNIIFQSKRTEIGTSKKIPIIICTYEGCYIKKDCKKIIMTTDQDLINDGVQAIDDEFLEWFVKNPSCENVTVYDGLFKDRIWRKHIIIPKEEPTIVRLPTYYEPKQETTLEEAAKEFFRKFKHTHSPDNYYLALVEFAKLQQEQDKLDEDSIRLDERCKCELENITTFSEGYDAGISQQEKSYSEEEVLEILDHHTSYLQTFIYQYIDRNDMEENEDWFEQFKKTS
jgi:hypothetical protein